VALIVMASMLAVQWLRILQCKVRTSSASFITVLLEALLMPKRTGQC
jgi:hypothetical protein